MNPEDIKVLNAAVAVAFVMIPTMGVGGYFAYQFYHNHCIKRESIRLYGEISDKFGSLEGFRRDLESGEEDAKAHIEKIRKSVLMLSFTKIDRNEVLSSAYQLWLWYRNNVQLPPLPPRTPDGSEGSRKTSSPDFPNLSDGVGGMAF